MKQTAVEWLMQTLEQNNIIDLDVIDSDKYYTIIEQAKEMEKQQQGYSEEDLKEAFKDAYTIGFRTSIFDVNLKQENCDEWFEQFKKK